MSREAGAAEAESKEDAVPETVTPLMQDEAEEKEAKNENDAAAPFDKRLLPETRMTFRRITELCLNKADREARSSDPDAVAEKLLNIRTARLDWQGFTEIDSLEALTNIRDLYLQYNHIRRIENLDFHVRLRYLALGHNDIERIENLAHLRNLQVLDLNHNRIDVLDLTALPPNLRNLDLQGNPCTEVPNYREQVGAKLSQLVLLDDQAVRSAPGSATEKGKKDEEGRVELKPLRSARSGPPSATHRSDALMEAALARIDELSRETSLHARKSFSEKRRGLVERSRERMRESEEAFANRVVPTIENTLPQDLRQQQGSEATQKNQT